MERVRVGIVGCGEVSQIMHLPSLAFLADRFEVTALCDVSAQVVSAVGRRWGVETCCTDHRDLVGRDDVDAVLVASPDASHAAVTVAALGAGKHVLVEKPMCISLREADEIEAVARDAGRVVQVGYVRRYAPAVLEAKTLLPALGPVRFARVRDVLGLNSLIVEQTSRVERADERDAELVAGHRAARDESPIASRTSSSREVADAYLLLLSLGSHDASLLRELVGRPESVLYAATRHHAWHVSAALDYGSFVCHFEIGFDRIPRVDTRLELLGETKALRLAFDTPFVRNLPVRLTLTEANEEGGVVERSVHPRWGDPFVGEWEAFHASVTEGAEVRTTPADFRHDLELFAEMARHMRGRDAA